MSPARTTEYTPRHAEPAREARPALSRAGSHLVIDLDAPRPASAPAAARASGAFDYFGNPERPAWGSDPAPEREAVWQPGDPLERPARHPGWRPPASPSQAARRSTSWWRRRR